jgi:hypothetical protein
MPRGAATAAARAATASGAQALRRRRGELRPGSAVPLADRPLARAARARASGMLDALLRGRGWIGLVGLLLAGIVFFNVDLLRLNREIAATTGRAATVKRKNARLRLELARLVSSERIQRAAAARGLVLPAPGDVRYLRAAPRVDAREAARRIRSPGGTSAPTGSVRAEAPVATAPATAAPTAGTPPAAVTPPAPRSAPVAPDAPAVAPGKGTATPAPAAGAAGGTLPTAAEGSPAPAG